MNRWRAGCIVAAVVCTLAVMTACGNKPVETKQGGGVPQLAAGEGQTGGSAGSSNSGSGNGSAGSNAGVAPDKAPAGPESRGAALDPGAARAYLAAEAIPNGDIYLGDGGMLHINIVGLSEEIEQRFKEQFPDAAYKLVDVTYTHEELEAAQDALIEHDLHRKLNLYSSSIDVIGNRLEIQMPDSSDGAQAEIEQYIDPAMIVYHLETLGEPQVVGTIHEVDTAESRILILEDGLEQPTYWMSFNAFSEMAGAAGDAVAFDDLAVDQQVRIWTTGMVLESMPAQATVRRLELQLAEE